MDTTKPKGKAKTKAKAKATAKASATGKGKAQPLASQASEASQEDAQGKNSRGSLVLKRPAGKAQQNKAKRASVELEEPAGGKKARASRTGKEKATFARRWRPTCEPSGAIWDAMKRAFEKVVEPNVVCPSRQEDLPALLCTFFSFYH